MKDKHGQGQRSTSLTDVRKEATRGGRPRQRSLRKRNRHPVALGIAAVAIAVGLGLYILVAPSFASTPVPCLGGTGESYIHVHPYIRINIEGTNVPIPALIGFLKAGVCTEQIHTHDASGIIHIELGTGDVNSNYTLADFFRVWNATFPTVSFNSTTHPVTFTNTGIFGYKADATHKLVVLVDNATVADGAGIHIEQLDYCSTANSAVPPCSPTAGGNPLWNGSTNYPYGTGHTIVIEYVKT
jgi:hypothetical protein